MLCKHFAHRHTGVEFAEMATDQFDEYDAAVASNDAARLREVLERLHIGEANVLAIIEARLGRTSS